MKVLILTSNSHRHQYFARTIAATFKTSVVLTQSKQNYYILQNEASARVRKHFSKIKKSEEKWFGALDGDTAPETHEVLDINNPLIVDWALNKGFEVICLFGTTILKDIWLKAYPDKIINLHLGFSPFYKGSATLFWPFVNRELEYLGATIHLAIKEVDAGGVIRIIESDFRVGEDYYDITNRLIRDSILQFPSAVLDYLSGEVHPKKQEDIAGRFYRKTDFSEAVLIKALKYSNQGLSEKEINLIIEKRRCLYLQ